MVLLKYNNESIILILFLPYSYFQLRIEAKDSGIPPLRDVEVLTVNINRNMNAPTLTVNAYEEWINEDIGYNERILQVLATDVDTQVL